MPAIGSINVKLGVTTGGLITGLGVGAKAITGFAGQMQGLGSGVLGLANKFGPLAGAITGVAGAAGMGLLVANSLEALDANAKLARSIGVSQETLTGYQHAAELSGVSSEALTGALHKLTRQGIDLDVLADKMAAIDDPTERAKLAFDVLGKSGSTLIPLLSEGGDKIREMVGEGAHLKGVFSDEDIAMVEEANDAVSRVKASFVGVANSIAVAVAPALKTVADFIVPLGTGLRDAFEDCIPIFQQFGTILTATWTVVADGASQVWNWLTGATSITFTNVRDFILDSLILGEFAFKNFGEVVGIVWDKIALGATSAFSNIGHFFTAVIPGWLSWFSTNWSDVFFTAFDVATTVFINLGENLRKIFTEIWNMVKSGFTDEIDLSQLKLNLADGFHNSISKLPDIPERELSSWERAQAQSIEDRQASILDRAGEHLNKRRTELLGPTENIKETPKLSIPELGEDGVIFKKLKELDGPTAVQARSKDAFSAMLRNVRGGPDNDLKKTATNQLREQTRLRQLAEKEAKQPRITFIAGADV